MSVAIDRSSQTIVESRENPENSIHGCGSVQVRHLRVFEVEWQLYEYNNSDAFEAQGRRSFFIGVFLGKAAKRECGVLFHSSTASIISEVDGGLDTIDSAMSSTYISQGVSANNQRLLKLSLIMDASC